jgi:hypothetical protein
MIANSPRALFPTAASCLASGKGGRRNQAMRWTRHRKLPRSTWRGCSLPPVRIVPGEGVPNFRCAAIGAHPFSGASAQRHDCCNANSKKQGGQHG